MKAREIRKMRAEKRKCPYCGNLFYSGCMCGACYGRREQVHHLWLVCQDLKKILEKREKKNDE